MTSHALAGKQNLLNVFCKQIPLVALFAVTWFSQAPSIGCLSMTSYMWFSSWRSLIARSNHICSISRAVPFRLHHHLFMSNWQQDPIPPYWQSIIFATWQTLHTWHDSRQGYKVNLSPERTRNRQQRRSLENNWAVRCLMYGSDGEGINLWAQ